MAFGLRRAKVGLIVLAISFHDFQPIQGGPKKRYPFYFCDNFRKCAPILTIFSLVEQEIYDT